LRLKGRRGPTAEREVSRGRNSRGSGEGPNGEESEAGVSYEGKGPQMSGQPERPQTSRGEAPKVLRGEEEPTAASETGRSGASGLMERVLEAANLKAALARVRKNKGSPGVDGVKTEDLPGYLREHWERHRSELLKGTYRPQPVRRAEIPKPGGGKRQLGIPTVLDRFIQQALLQVLQPRIDPSFSPHSFGFRPGRSAHDAVRQAQRYVQGGLRWVVDVDLETFFDRVNHDILMGKLAKRIDDGRVRGLIRRYLSAGMFAQGMVVERYEGTPQGGPLSPLLANVFLDEVDRELEKRGCRFVRYADDCNVYVGSQRAGQRVMGLLLKLYGRLKLRVNEAKSAVAPATRRKLLGYSLWVGPAGKIKRRVSPKAMTAMKERVRRITRRNGGRSIERVIEELRGYLCGWKEYFRLADTPGVFRELDQWIRHRLRAVQLKQWKRGRTVYRELRARGMSGPIAATVAANARRWWKNSAMSLNAVLPNRYFDGLGLPRLGT
jgi:RNA-directed DNA polymerase